MSFLSEKITEIGLPAELSLFTVPPNQVAVEKIYFAEHRPVSAYNTEGAPIEIAIPGQGNEYIDLRRSRLYAKCRWSSFRISRKNWHHKPTFTVTLVADRHLYEREFSVSEH